MIRYSIPYRSEQTCRFVQTETDIHALDSLTGSTFGQVVDTTGHDDLVGAGIEIVTDFAAVGHKDIFGISTTLGGQHPDKLFFAVSSFVDLADLFQSTSGSGIENDR